MRRPAREMPVDLVILAAILGLDIFIFRRNTAAGIAVSVITALWLGALAANEIYRVARHRRYLRKMREETDKKRARQ